MQGKQPTVPERRQDGAPDPGEGDMGEGSFTQSTEGGKETPPSRQGPKRVPVPGQDKRR